MTDNLIHNLIAQQVINIMKDKSVSQYSLMQQGINQSNIEAVLQKKKVSYTLKTLQKILKALDVSEIQINLKEGSLIIK